MIQKLRRRFILISMLSVAVVLLFIMGAINVLNYRNVVRDADTILAMLQASEGHFPVFSGGFPPEGAGPPDEAFSGDAFTDKSRLIPSLSDTENTSGKASEYDEYDGDYEYGEYDEYDESGEYDSYEELEGYAQYRDFNDFMHRQAGGRNTRGFGGIGGEFSEETPFESRYFTVVLDDGGSVLSADTRSIAAVTESEAASYASQVFNGSRASGFCKYYRYLKYDNADGGTCIIFLDCQRSLGDFRSFLLISILVSLAGTAAVFFLVLLLSKKAVRPIQESYEKQKQFITDAGHELKTPLTIIDADVSVLEMDIGENEWIDDVRVQTKRLADLTGDLIYLSRMNEDNIRLQKIDFPLSDIAEETVQSFRSRAQIEGKTFRADIQPMTHMYGDEKSIRQLLSILLDNAVKYSNEGGTITFSLVPKGKNVQIRATNTTDGIDPETLRHMFDRFYRADKSRSSEKSGYGIGLSIASAVTAAHKGEISSSSPDGHTMVIDVSLPAEP